MAPALLAGRTHLKEQQVENAILRISVFISHWCSLSFCPSLFDGRWQRPRLAIAVEDLASGSFPHILTLSRLSLGVVIDWREVTFKMKSRSVRKNVKAFMLSNGISINSLSTPPVPPLLLSLLTLHFCILSLSPLSLWLLALLSLSLSLSHSLCSLFTLEPTECVFASVCKCINERETGREREGSSECVLTHAFVCVFMCVRVSACVRDCAHMCACRGACWQTEAGGGTDRQREGGREGKREIEERSDEGRERQSTAPQSHFPVEVFPDDRHWGETRQRRTETHSTKHREDTTREKGGERPGACAVLEHVNLTPAQVSSQLAGRAETELCSSPLL